MDTPIEEPEVTPGLALAPRSLTDIALALGLRGNDRLEHIGGVPFRGSLRDLQARFERARREKPIDGKVLIGLVRDGKPFSVLTPSIALGYWRPIEAPVPLPEIVDRDYSDMINWEIRSDRTGIYDLIPRRNYSAFGWALKMALVPFWLIQSRLYLHLVMLAGLMLVCVPGGPLLMLAVWVAFSAWVAQEGPALWRADRAERGMTYLTVIAARSAGAAHLAFADLKPGARYLFEVEPVHVDETVPDGSLSNG